MLGFPAPFLLVKLFLSPSGVVQHTVASAADKEARCKVVSDGAFCCGDGPATAHRLLAAETQARLCLAVLQELAADPACAELTASEHPRNL